MAAERAYRGVSAEDRRTERRRRLLDTALEIWGAPERPRITMTGICQGASLTERYFYESFDNLDAALGELLDEIAAEVDRKTVAALAAAGTEPVARFRAVTEAFVATLAEDPRKGRVALIESATVEATQERRALLLRRLARLAGREARKLHGPTAWGDSEGVLAATMFVGGVVQLVTGLVDGTLDSTPSSVVDAAERSFRATAHL